MLTVIVGVLRHAANAVAAHLRLAAVRVEYPHPDIRFLRWHDENEAVRAHAEVPIRDRAGERRRVVHCLPGSVDENVVVSDPVHLREAHL